MLPLEAAPNSSGQRLWFMHLWFIVIKIELNQEPDPENMFCFPLLCSAGNNWQTFVQQKTHFISEVVLLDLWFSGLIITVENDSYSSMIAFVYVWK